MTAPPVRLICPHGHVGQYFVSKGRTTTCKRCRTPGECEQCAERNPLALIDGARVSIANSGRNRERAAAAEGRASAAEPFSERGQQLADYWQRQAPAADWRELLAAGDGTECPSCSAPMLSTSLGTALICPPCVTWARPQSAIGRAAEYLRRTRQSAEIAVRTPAELAETRASERRQRQQLAALGNGLTDQVRQMLELCKPELFRIPIHREAARALRSYLLSYPAEIARADVAELGDIAAELQLIRLGDQDYAAPNGITYTDLGEQLEQEAEQAEREQEAREFYAEQQRQAQARQQAAERQQLAEQQQLAEARPRETSGTVLLVPTITTAITAGKQARAALLAERGACEFAHLGGRQVLAERVYGISATARAPITRYGTARACRKHYAAADAWIERQLEQLGDAHPYQTYYWLLGGAP